MKENRLKDKFFLGGERKRIIDTYFGGIEQSTKEFNDRVYSKWIEEREQKRNKLITIVSLILCVVGIILIFV